MSSLIKQSKAGGLISFLRKKGIGHEIQLTTNTTTIIVETKKGDKKKYLVSDEFLTNKELGFVMQVKRYAESICSEKINVSVSEINYFKFSPVLNEGVFFDVVEMDVNGAYWKIALNKGYISEKIYKKGLTVSKKCRLVALGALATNKRVFGYDAKNDFYRHEKDIKNEVTRSMFFDIARELDMLMMEFCEMVNWDGVYFYWVDAFFMSRLRAKQLSDFFEQKGLFLKSVDARSMKVERKGNDYFVNVLIKRREQKGQTDIKIKPFQCLDRAEKRKKIMNEFMSFIPKHLRERERKNP